MGTDVATDLVHFYSRPSNTRIVSVSLPGILFRYYICTKYNFHNDNAMNLICMAQLDRLYDLETCPLKRFCYFLFYDPNTSIIL